MKAEDEELGEETLYALGNESLMEQIERSLKTHSMGTGYRPSPEELEALDRAGSHRGTGPTKADP
jgi:hypothetical protein